jgi:hypothetical protein
MSAAWKALVVAGKVTFIVAALARTEATRTLGTKSWCCAAMAVTSRCLV